MAIEIRQTQKLTQKLTLTPQMRQALEILQLPLMELKQFLQKEVVENPLLEEIEEGASYDEGEADLNAKEKEELDKFLQLDDNIQEYFRINENIDLSHEKAKRDFRESSITKPLSLEEHLIQQLKLLSTSKQEKEIGELIIGNLDENGYLKASVDEIAQFSNTAPQKVEKVLALIQLFEPPGVASRNLKECLLLQLKHQHKEHSFAAKILESRFEELKKKKYDKIARALKTTVEQVKEAVKTISKLEPKPGGSFGVERTRYIKPDLTLRKIKDTYEVMLNDEELPHFQISPHYRKLLTEGKITPATRDYLKKKLNAALWLIKTVNQRHQTILKITECIVEIQKEFLEKGIAYLKPLTIKEVAALVGRAESTVARVVVDKFVQTPYGIFRLKDFFSGGIKTEEGIMLSSKNVISIIAELIKNEEPNKPLSDQQIVNRLHQQGISIARRTVTKYREKLKLLPSNLRKR